MSSDSCPKTCSLLSVATILISVGIVQLLAGIILLKAEDVYLLAGTDFVVAASNISVGSLLGIAASMWEKKKKVASLKSTARQNALAGLYISALSMNATGAIIMILGDGSKLLTSNDNTANESGDFIFEIMACAYVTSVCSPIVCLVIALVCLSSNRIRIYDNMKRKDSLIKPESYEWVFENNYDSQARNLGAVLQDSVLGHASVSDDNVFVDKKPVGKLFETKPSKKNNSRDSVTSVSELKTPSEIWAHKRNKILKEITSPQPKFFADDYLQFPDYKYDSYIENKIPRITETCFIERNNCGRIQTSQTTNSKMAKNEKTMSCKHSKSHLDELNHKLASRRISFPDSADFIGKIDCYEELDGSPKTAFQNVQKMIDETDAQTPNSAHSKLQRTYANSVESKQQRQTVCFDFDDTDSPQLPYGSRDIVEKQSHFDWLQDPHTSRRNSNDSSSSGLTAETISELKAKLKKMNFDADDNYEPDKEILKSFKNDGKRKSHLSESDVKDKRSTFQRLHEKYSVFSQNSENDSKILAGEFVPISIRPNSINRSNSIPLKTVSSQAPNRYSINVKQNTSNPRQDVKSENTQLLTNGDSQSSQRTHPYSYSCREKSSSNSDIKLKICGKRSEQNFDFKQRMSSMGSIAESPKEEFLQNEDIPKSNNTGSELENSSPNAGNERHSPKNRLRRAGNSFSLKRLSSKATPNLLNRLWSMKRPEIRADLTSLIMDSDSLVGLTDEELMARTSRLRQLRKSVEMRSKTEKQEDVV